MEASPFSSMQEAFDAVFIAPFASHRWKSARARSHWVDLEGWQDSLAGPLSSVVKYGGCNYVYSRDDGFFAGVGDPDVLRTRLLQWHAGLQAGVETFSPLGPDEAEELKYMRSITEQMRSLVEWACKVEYDRWSVEKKTD